MMARVQLLVGVLLLLACRIAPAEEALPLPVDRMVGSRVGDFRLRNVQTDEEVWLYGIAQSSRLAGTWLKLPPLKAAVLAFVSPGCPLGEKYLPRLGELAREYGEKGIFFFGIASNAGDTVADLKAWAEERTPGFPILHDPGNVVADSLMVERTNEVVLVDLRGRLRYRGAIDDQYGYDFSLPAARHTFLRDALEALISLPPQQVAVKGTPVAGCRLTKVAPQPSQLDSLDRVRPASPEIAAWLDSQEQTSAPVGPITYTSGVAGILQAKCQACHRPGQVGGFSLLNYEDAQRHSAMIGEVVANRRMPPWHADPRHGHFTNDRRLAPSERAALLAWVEQGAPQGDGPEPQPREWPEGWTIGTPDIVFSLPQPNPVPAQGTLPYANISVPTNFAEDVWVQAAEARPGNPAVVHHIIVYVEALGEKRGRGTDGHLCGYAPGDMPSVYPLGTGKRIPAGSTLKFQVHYTPNGTATTDISSVGLILAKEPPVREALTVGIVNPKFVIPAGAADHPVKSRKQFDRPVRLLAFMPHMHLRGKSFRYFLDRQPADPEVLLDVPAYDFGWQSYYTLLEPRELPAGATILCHATFDNSASNRANPDPTVNVTWGEQTWEEMMIGYVDIDFPRDQSSAIQGSN